MIDWQPIEMAPRDGWTDVLLFSPGGYAVAYWDADDQEWVSDYRGKGNGCYVTDPTHWASLHHPQNSR